MTTPTATRADIRARTNLRQARASMRLVAGSLLLVAAMPLLSIPSSAGVSPTTSVVETSAMVAATTIPEARRAAPPAFGEAGKQEPSIVASSATPLTVHNGPDTESPSRLLDPATEASGRLVFLVRDQVDDWLEVYLPVRPNGSTGWLQRDDVEVSEHGYRIELSLSERTLVLFDGAQVLMEESIGVGAGNTPTPGGVYYIKELLRPSDPSGFYGPYAYGLSGFSNVLDDYRGGTGVIGLHGNDDDSSIGRDVSHGCIRLHNQAIIKMVEVIGLPLGTPVIIEV